MCSIKTDAVEDRACLGALLDEQVYNPLHITLSKDELAIYGNDDDDMMTFVRSKVKSFIAGDSGRNNAERLGKIQTEMEENLLNMLKLGISAAENRTDGICSNPGDILPQAIQAWGC